MRAELSAARKAATNCAVQLVSETNPQPPISPPATSTAQTGSEDNAWFSEPAQSLLGSDPGLALNVLTGVPDRSCYRYASGERAVTGYIVYRLLRSKHGRQWLNAFMDGCEEEWWLALQDEIRVGAAVRSVLSRE